MRIAFVSLVTVLTIVLGTLVSLPWTLPACPTEDSLNCIWLSNVQGNGRGESYISLSNDAFYLQVYMED